MNQEFIINDKSSYSLSDFFARIYALVGIGVAVSALVAFLFLGVFSSNVQAVLTGHSWLMYGSWILEMVLILAIGPLTSSNSPLALPAFIGYSALNGFTLSLTLAYFSITSIAMAFAVTAGMFFSLSIFGKVTKRDLSGMGKAMFAGLIGVIIAMVVNIFVRSSGLNFLTTILSVIIFSGLIAWDNQKIARVYEERQGQVTDGWAISMALALYLDFVNLFISILRLFGRSDD